MKKIACWIDDGVFRFGMSQTGVRPPQSGFPWMNRWGNDVQVSSKWPWCIVVSLDLAFHLCSLLVKVVYALRNCAFPCLGASMGVRMRIVTWSQSELTKLNERGEPSFRVTGRVTNPNIPRKRRARKCLYTI